MMGKFARATFCNHYRAMAKFDTCVAGVRYDSFGQMPFNQRPCFRKDASEPVRCGCDLVQFPTAEEVAEADAWIEERFARTGKAREAIVEFCGGPWKRGDGGMSGTIDCPCCGAKDSLAFSRSGYNGHIHAACKTDDCVNWME